MRAPALPVVVWIDRQSARLFALSQAGAARQDLHNDCGKHGRVHHKAGVPGPGHADMERQFLADVAAGLADANPVLILGPAQAKFDLETYLDEYWPAIAGRVIAVKTFPRKSPAEICAFARRVFRAARRMGKPPYKTPMRAHI